MIKHKWLFGGVAITANGFGIGAERIINLKTK
jgi:hypothetical protein